MFEQYKPEAAPVLSVSFNVKREKESADYTDYPDYAHPVAKSCAYLPSARAVRGLRASIIGVIRVICGHFVLSIDSGRVF
jgi:hypothetical protein